MMSAAIFDSVSRSILSYSLRGIMSPRINMAISIIRIAVTPPALIRSSSCVVELMITGSIAYVTPLF